MITKLFWTIILLYLVIDITIVGGISRLFKIWPPLSNYLGKSRLLCSTVAYSYRTNIPDKLYDSQIAKRIHILRFLITDQWLIVKNTIFTCLPPIRVSDIGNYQIKKGVFGHKVFFNFKDGTRYFRIRVTGVEKLEEVLKKVNINQHNR